MTLDVFSLHNDWVWLAGLCIFFIILWFFHLVVLNASLADVGFCFSFGILVVVCGISAEGDYARRLLIVCMGIVYACRLGGFLFINRVWKKREDPRYQKLRELLGQWQGVGMFGYFQVQAPASLAFATFLCWIMNHPAVEVRWSDSLGMMIFFVAIIGESVADRQLQVFRDNPSNRDKTLQTGLWRYSRHPNYFFEALHWWAYVPMAIGLPWGWLAVLWPMVMTVSLIWVTGVPWAEAQALARRGNRYRDYQRRTSMFFPWFPKKG